MTGVAPDGAVRVSATDFKTHCLALFTHLVEGQLHKVVVTRHGKPIAEVSGVSARPSGRVRFEDIAGAMGKSITVAPDYDPYEPVVPEPDTAL